MNLPSLPTDNLYKFMALCGLFLVVFGLVFPSTRIDELNLKAIEINTQAEVLRIEIDDLEYDTDLWAKKVTLNPEETDLLRKRTREIKIRTAEITGRMEQHNILRITIEHYWRVLKVTIWVGFILSLVGFYCWYFLVQRPNDLLLRKQIKEEKI
jgi:hypothetical protein